MPCSAATFFSSGAGVDGADVDAEALLDVVGLLLHALGPVMPASVTSAPSSAAMTAAA